MSTKYNDTHIILFNWT